MHFEVRVLTPVCIETRHIEADSAFHAQQLTDKPDCTILGVKEVRHAGSLHRKNRFSLVRFSQELMVLLEAGLTVVEATETLAEKEPREGSRIILNKLIDDLRQGKGFAGALEEQAMVFPSLYVSLIRSSERTSSLKEALQRYVAHALQIGTLKDKIIHASIYPAILLAVGGLVSLFLLGYVVPRFAQVYQETGRSLPKLSMLLLQWGNFASSHPVQVGTALAICVMAALAGSYRLFVRGDWMALVSHIPAIERRVRDFHLARMYLTLGMLLEGGLAIVQSSQMVEALVMPKMRISLQHARTALESGQSISRAFSDNALTSPAVARMLRVGEQAGDMGAMMTRIAAQYDQEVSHTIEWFSRIFEPVLMLAIGLIIGVVVVLLYMPIFDLAGSLN